MRRGRQVLDGEAKRGVVVGQRMVRRAKGGADGQRTRKSHQTGSPDLLIVFAVEVRGSTVRMWNGSSFRCGVARSPVMIVAEIVVVGSG